MSENTARQLEDDQRRSRNTMLAALACVLGVTALGCLAALLASDTRALWGALMGGLVGLLFSLPTALLALLTRGKQNVELAATVMISWLVKIVLVMVAVKLLSGADFFSRPWFGWVLLACVLCAALGDYLALVRKPLPSEK